MQVPLKSHGTDDCWHRMAGLDQQLTASLELQLGTRERKSKDDEVADNGNNDDYDEHVGQTLCPQPRRKPRQRRQKNKATAATGVWCSNPACRNSTMAMTMTTDLLSLALQPLLSTLLSAETAHILLVMQSDKLLCLSSTYQLTNEETNKTMQATPCIAHHDQKVAVVKQQTKKTQLKFQELWQCF